MTEKTLPTREQIAEVVLDGFHAPDGDHPSWWINPLATADAVLALLSQPTPSAEPKESGVCHCGTDMDAHNWADGHNPVDMAAWTPLA